jgi:hypothetical protein
MCSPAERMIMSLAAELACAARALGAAGERLQLPDAVLVEEWLKLEDAVDDAHGRGGESYGSCSGGEPSTNDLPIVTCTEFEGPQRLPKKGTKAAKLAAQIKKRMTEPNPCQAGYEKALGPYLAADRALSDFKRARLHDRLAELEPHHETAVATIREGLELLKRGCEQYRAGVDGVRAITTDMPGLERRRGMYRFDPGPEEWERLASEALDREILRPGVSEEGEWWANNDG